MFTSGVLPVSKEYRPGPIECCFLGAISDSKSCTFPYLVQGQHLQVELSKIPLLILVFPWNELSFILNQVLQLQKNWLLSSHLTSGEKCVEIVKTLHVKFFLFGTGVPARKVAVRIISVAYLHDNFWSLVLVSLVGCWSTFFKIFFSCFD